MVLFSVKLVKEIAAHIVGEVNKLSGQDLMFLLNEVFHVMTLMPKELL